MEPSRVIMLLVNSRHNLHTLDRLVSPERLGAHSGNMKRLIDLKLVCSKCKARVFTCTCSRVPTMPKRS
jgi:hypothetical protein